MTKRDFLKVQIALAIAGTVALGGVSSVLANDTFPSASVTVDTDTTYTTSGTLVSKDVTISGQTGNEKVIVKNDAALANGTLHEKGTLTFSNLGTLEIQSDADKNSKGGISAWGGKVTVSNVKNVQIGSKEERYAAGGGQAIHAISGGVFKAENIGNLTIYTENQGIMAQRNNNKDDPNAFSVDIAAKGNIVIDANNRALMAASLNDQPGIAAAKLSAEGTVTLYSANNVAVESFDLNQKPNQWKGNGATNIVIDGKQGVSIGSGTTAAINTVRSNQANTSKLSIVSSDGDVNIKGVNGVLSKDNIGNSNISNTITGNNVTIEGSAGNAVDLVGTELILKTNKANGNILISSPDKTAIYVNGVNSESGKGLVIGGDTETNVYIDGFVNISNAGKIEVADKTTAYVDAKYLTNENQSFITTDKKGKVDFQDGSKLVIQNAQTGTTFKLSNDEALSQSIVDKVYTNNVLQKLEVQSDGSLKTGVVDTATAEKALAGSILTNVALAATQNNDADVTALFADLNLTTAEKVKNLNTLANFGELAGFSHSTYTASLLFTDAVGAHLSDGASDSDIWASYVHGKESVDGLGLAGGIAANYDATYDGAVVGMDLYQSGNTTAGAAISYVNGSIEGAGVTNDADFYGLSFYGRKDLSGYALVGDVSYLHGSHDITATIGSGTFAAKPDADVLTVGVKALKDFQVTESSKLTPYVGARYLRINTESYNAGNLRYDADSQDLFLVPLGVDYSAEFKAGEWTYRPLVGIGYIWNAAGRSVDQTVSLAGAADSFSFDTVDQSSFIARVGFSAEKDNLSFGVGYQYEDGDSTSADKWTVSAAYRF